MMAKLILTILWLLIPISLFTQSGMTVAEFKVKLEGYFNNEMVDDVFRKIPQNTRFTIWGWDVGDYSGDGNPDLAFSIKITGETRRITYVYFFVDIDGYLELILVEPYEYVELPLEVGVAIRNNKCSITQKKKKDIWQIKSYTFEDGVIYLIEEYLSQNYLGNNLETVVNYKTNECKFTLESLSREKLNFEAKYYFIPSYPRNKPVYKGFSSRTNIDKIDYVIKGSYYWRGDYDASMSVKSSFDNNFIYFTITVTDDVFVPKECENCIGDKISFWFDFQPFRSSFKRLFKQSGSQLLVRSKPDGSIFKIEINLGNLVDKSPYVESINSTEPFDDEQKRSVEKIKLLFTTNEDKYVLKARIPVALFGYDMLPYENDEPVFIGFNIVYVDVDNEFRPNEITYITNSSFEESQPATFGELVILPDYRKFGFAKNIYVDSILNLLENFGF